MGFSRHSVEMELRASPVQILEISFQRLLAHTKSLLQSSKAAENHWRCVKYVERLEEILRGLEKQSKTISRDTLVTYKEEVKFIKELLSTANKEDKSESLLLSQKLIVPTSSSKGASVESQTSTTSLKDLKKQAVSLYAKDLRKQLLGAENDSGDIGLRLRSVKTVQTSAFDEDFDSVISHHNKLQGQLAEDFLLLTQNLKTNVTIAGRVVQDDNKKLEKISTVAETNKTKLEKEAKRLEKHANSSCECWIWLLLFLVCATFISMVMFIRLFPKQ